MSEQSFDVAVVGMGPVGSAAAILFADAGLSVVAFERDEAVYPLPRAVGMDGEVVRGFQRVGRGDALAALLQPLRGGDRAGFANSRREWLFGNEWRNFGSNGWQPISMFDQPEVESWLRTTASGHPQVTARPGTEVTGFRDLGDSVEIDSQHQDGSTIRTSQTNQTNQTRARYLIACDGASSDTRRALDIPWNDLGYDHDWLVVDVVARPGHTLTLDTLQVCDPDRLATYIATKDPFRRWEFKLNPGETPEQMLEPETIYRLIEDWTPPDTVELRRAAVYTFHAATAERWRVGRVLLAGDAAHQTPPFLGQGLNAGMRDVINLAWKLPLVISGHSSDALLDSYHAERGAHAEDLVEWAVALGKLMEHLAAVEAAERAGQPPPEADPNQQSSGYGQGREAPPLRGGILIADQVSDTGATGYLFRQPRVRDADGREFLLDERLGQGFAIVARHPGDLVMGERAQALVERLGIALVTTENLEASQGSFDRILETAGAVIVRPDRYLFGHTTDSLSLDDLLARLEDQLELANT